MTSVQKLDVDVVKVLTEQETVRSASTYWAVLKKRLKEDVADVEQ